MKRTISFAKIHNIFIKTNINYNGKHEEKDIKRRVVK